MSNRRIASRGKGGGTPDSAALAANLDPDATLQSITAAASKRSLDVLDPIYHLAKAKAQDLRRALLSQPSHVLQGLIEVISDTLRQCVEDASGSLTVPTILNVLNGAAASAGEMWRLYLNGRLNRAQSLKMRGLAVPLLKALGLLNLKVAQLRTPSDVSGELVRSCVSFVLDILSTIPAADDSEREGRRQEEEGEEGEEEEGQKNILLEVESLIDVAMQCDKEGVWNIAAFGVVDQAHRKFILASLIRCLQSLGEIQRGIPAARFLLDRIEASTSDEGGASPVSSSLSHSHEFQAEEFCRFIGLSALIEAKSCSKDVVLRCIYELNEEYNNNGYPAPVAHGDDDDSNNNMAANSECGGSSSVNELRSDNGLDRVSSSTQPPSIQRLLWKAVSQYIIANNADFASALFDEVDDATIAHMPPPASEGSQVSVSMSVTTSATGSENEAESERESADEGGGADSNRAHVYKEFVSGALMSAIARANPDAIMVTRLLVLYRIHHKLHMSRNGFDQIRKAIGDALALPLEYKCHSELLRLLNVMPLGGNGQSEEHDEFLALTLKAAGKVQSAEMFTRLIFTSLAFKLPPETILPPIGPPPKPPIVPVPKPPPSRSRQRFLEALVRKGIRVC